MFESDDRVGDVEHRLPVGNEDHRAVATRLLQRFMYQTFALHIDLAGSFVQDQDFRVAQYSSCQRDSLTLSATQSVPILSDDCIVLCGQFIGNELMSVRQLCCFDDLLPRHVLGNRNRY